MFSVSQPHSGGRCGAKGLARSDFDFASLLVADQGGRVVGFSEFGMDREGTGRGEIFGFYLHAAAWGQGAATQLMTTSLLVDDDLLIE
jgi:RimJ/RimL family protein N-acetyltransferase